ncbi:hypothetical protein ACM0P9_09315 [Streptococcus pluranimalium]
MATLSTGTGQLGYLVSNGLVFLNEVNISDLSGPYIKLGRTIYVENPLSMK